MELTAPRRLPVTDASGVAPARRALSLLSREQGLSEEDAGRAAIVVTELATNLVRHTRGGEIVLREAPGAIEIIAWDRGPGMRDVQRSLADGFSTVGGSGTGLGAVQRIADSFEISSAQPSGTIVMATITRRGRGSSDSQTGPGRVEAHGPSPSRAAGLVLAVAPETVSGDAWGAAGAPDGETILLADGLGHGPGAAEASERAVAALRPGEPVVETLERVHGALRSTRGAAVAVAQVDRQGGVVHFAGVGNVAAAICEPGASRSLASMSGTAGRQVRTLRAFDYELPASGFLIMHSDGVRSGWDFDADPALRRRSALMIAATLIRDWERGRDDASVVVLPLGPARS